MVRTQRSSISHMTCGLLGFGLAWYSVRGVALCCRLEVATSKWLILVTHRNFNALPAVGSMTTRMLSTNRKMSHPKHYHETLSPELTVLERVF